VIDFYMVLNDALKARGLYYDAYTVTNTDVELPMVDPSSPTSLSDVRLIDHDAILVRKDHHSVQILADNYATSVGQDFDGIYIEFIRGFVVVDVDIKDTIYRFANTHLEVAGDTESILRVVQSAQMQELLLTLDYLNSVLDPEPIIMVGDFNSSPEDIPGLGYHPVYNIWIPYVPPYLLATDPFYSGKEYLDTWILQENPNKPIFDEGYTSGFEELINDPNDTLETRIDHIFLDPYNLELEKSRGEVVGDKATDMVPNSNDPGHYLWPSDHAGVVTRLKFEVP
jgi:hypothetical protein